MAAETPLSRGEAGQLGAEGYTQEQMRLFIGCIVALVATSFGFIIRALILNDWGVQFNLSETQKVLSQVPACSPLRSASFSSA